MGESVNPEYVQPPTRVDGPITLAAPDARWESQYAEEERSIRSVLGARALQVEHIGSTSIPGLAAKPILDIVLAVADPAEERAYVPDLAAVGYVLHVREPEWHEHRLLKRRSPGVNLHVFARGDSEIERLVVFRDRLRANADDRDRYEAVKRELAKQSWTHVQDYADAKSTVVEQILSRAVQEHRPA